MSPLKYKQLEFTRRITRLLFYATDVLKYNIKLGEAYRPPEMAEIYAKQGKGIKNSLHTLGLALDITRFDEKGEPMYDANAYYAIAQEWKRMSSPAFEGKMGFPARPALVHCWGGDFKTLLDPYHFSISHDGIS